jgi:hypothetical protein
VIVIAKAKIKVNGNIRKKKSMMLCIILRSNRNVIFSWQPTNKSEFSIARNTYFIDPKGAYVDNNNSFTVATYLEGSSLPVHHGCLKYNKVKKEVVKRLNPFSGAEEEFIIPEHTEIDSVKYDSGLIDMLLNRRLADVFTKVHMDLPNLLLTILLIGSLVVGIVNLGVQFYV